MQQTILIAGHTGFIGRHVVAEFLLHGWLVIGVSRRTLSNMTAANMTAANMTSANLTAASNLTAANLTQYQCDLQTKTGLEDLKAIIEKYNCRILLNLVWDVSANCHSSLTAIDSMNMSLNVAKIFAESNVRGKKNLIGAGTNAEYTPHKDNGLLVEDDLSDIKPDSIYGVCKFSTFKILEKLCEDYDIAFKWPRIFSAFGLYMRPTCFMLSLMNSIHTKRAFTINNGNTITHFTPVELIAKALYNLIASNVDVTTGAVNIAAKPAFFTTQIADFIIDHMDASYKPLLTVKYNTVAHQNPSFKKHDIYIYDTFMSVDSKIICKYILNLINWFYSNSYEKKY